MKIEIISGSARSNSITKRVALNLIKQLKEDTNHEIGIIDMKDWDLPPLQSVFKSLDTTPDEFKSLSKRIFEADAFILVSPEYNGSYAPALKNLLDHYPKQHHKPFGIVTASPGSFGGIRATQQMLLLVSALFGIASPYLLVVPAVEKKFNVQGELLDESFQNSIHNFITEYLWLAENLVKDKIVI
ncbi:MAG TPA: NAD(P)H-dependent oxidoreductase [Chitinophagaceae bacterium]|nr:NAD(P)H-dependent oxidoreductase [Chitinophagaceae bacterium]